MLAFLPSSLTPHTCVVNEAESDWQAQRASWLSEDLNLAFPDLIQFSK